MQSWLITKISGPIVSRVLIALGGAIGGAIAAYNPAVLAAICGG